MVGVKKEGILLNKTKLGFEVDAVLNPAVIAANGSIHLFYRAVAKGNYSSIGHCILKNPLEVEERFDTPVIFPQFDYELHGTEDPRITKIDDLFYLTYTAYDGVNALGALATSKDLKQWDKQGIIVPKITFSEFNRLASAKQTINEKYARYNSEGGTKEKDGKQVFVWDKNVIFFPRRINGKLFFLHRIKPDIQIVCVNNLQELTTEFWQNYFLHLHENVVLAPKYDFGVSYLGGGCPPIETEFGWLLIYHGVHDTVNGYVYAACAALLDLQNPQKEISSLPYPLFKPDKSWELKGEVNNVCFPTGSITVDDTLYIYYGAADEQIAVASVSLSALLKELLINTLQNDK
jgi:beta-1,2-mannobiose phosphorylase / 1,2-beta-oligomannan phosphorylase